MTHKLKIVRVCESPQRGLICLLALFLFFLGQLLLITAVGRELGWVDLWSAWRTHLVGNAGSYVTYANLRNSTIPKLALNELPQMPVAACPLPARRAHPLSDIN